MDDTPIPPEVRQPNTPRVWLPKIGAFIKDHWVWCGPVIALVIGFLLGKLL